MPRESSIWVDAPNHRNNIDTGECELDVQRLVKDIGPIAGLGETVAENVASTLIAVGELVNWENGYEFISEGDETDDRGFVLLTGSASVTKSSGKSLNVSAPALLGEMKQHSATGKRGATVSTVGPCACLVFEWGALHSRLGRELAAGDWAAFRIALERYSWDYLLNEGL